MSNILHSSLTNEWYTPELYVNAVRRVMNGIDLDPASCERANQIVRAKHIYTKDDDGLAKPWFGRVFLNPPYGKCGRESNQSAWSKKFIDEYVCGNIDQGILLVNATPGNKWFVRLWGYPICFVSRRIGFISADGVTRSAPTHSNCFVYVGRDIDQFAFVFSALGTVVTRYSAEYSN